MEWRDSGIVLAARPHGESACVLQVLTVAHGRHGGLVRGGNSRRLRPVLQPGSEIELRWRARLADQLGSFTIEPRRAHGAALMQRPRALAGLLSALAVCESVLPEREPHRRVHDGVLALIGALGESPTTVWAAAYVRWELGMLDELGYGLDLTRCALTGSPDDLAFVSPRTGRAVCREAAAPYRDRLLALPDFLLGSQADQPRERAIRDGLRLTGHFLERHLWQPAQKTEPPARQRLVDSFSRQSTTSSGTVTP